MSMTIDMREAPAAVIDLRGLMSVFNRRKKLIAAVTAACVLLALVVALLMTPRYVSQIKILIDPRGLQILPNDLSPGAVSADATFAVVESQDRKGHCARIGKSMPLLPENSGVFGSI